MMKRLWALLRRGDRRPPQLPSADEMPGSSPTVVIDLSSQKVEAVAPPTPAGPEAPPEPAQIDTARVDVAQGDSGEVNLTVVHATTGESPGGPAATVTWVTIHPAGSPPSAAQRPDPVLRKPARRQLVSPSEVQPLLRRTPASEHAFRSIYRNPSRYREVLATLYLAEPKERGLWVATWFRERFPAAWESARQQYQQLREGSRLPRSLDTETEFLEAVAELWAAQLWDWADHMIQTNLPFQQAVERSQGLTGMAGNAEGR